MPDCASVCRNDNYIHVDPLAGRAFVAKAVVATRITSPQTEVEVPEHLGWFSHQFTLPTARYRDGKGGASFGVGGPATRYCNLPVGGRNS